MKNKACFYCQQTSGTLKRILVGGGTDDPFFASQAHRLCDIKYSVVPRFSSVFLFFAALFISKNEGLVFQYAAWFLLLAAWAIFCLAIYKETKGLAKL